MFEAQENVPFGAPLLSSVIRALWLPTLAAHMSRVRLSVRPEASSFGTSSHRPLVEGASLSMEALLHVLGTCREHGGISMHGGVSTPCGEHKQMLQVCIYYKRIAGL